MATFCCRSTGESLCASETGVASSPFLARRDLLSSGRDPHERAAQMRLLTSYKTQHMAVTSLALNSHMPYSLPRESPTFLTSKQPIDGPKSTSKNNYKFFNKNKRNKKKF